MKRFAREFWIWACLFIIVGMLIGATIVTWYGIPKTIAAATTEIETYGADAVLINNEWRQAPLIKWYEDPEDKNFFLVFLNDLQGDMNGIGDNIEIHRIPRTEFQTVKYMTIE